MSDYPNIAFTGKAGSGKSTAASALVEGRGYQRVSFAAPLKDIAVQIWGPDAFTDRGKLQQLGKKVREIDEGAWANMARRRIEELQARGVPIVIDDLRFPNEFWLLKELGFAIVRVEADRHDRISRLKQNGKLQDEAQLDDVSETALDGFDFDHTVVNDRDLFDLGERLVDVLQRERARV